MSRRETGYLPDQLEYLSKFETAMDIRIYNRVYRGHIIKDPQDLERIRQVLLFKNSYEDIKAKIGIIQTLVEIINNPVYKTLEGKDIKRLDTIELTNILNENIVRTTHAVIQLMKAKEPLSSGGVMALNEFILIIPEITKNLFPEERRLFTNMLAEVEELIDDIKNKALIINRELNES
jgi:hypothetical protein